MSKLIRLYAKGITINCNCGDSLLFDNFSGVTWHASEKTTAFVLYECEKCGSYLSIGKKEDSEFTFVSNNGGVAE